MQYRGSSRQHHERADGCNDREDECVDGPQFERPSHRRRISSSFCCRCHGRWYHDEDRATTATVSNPFDDDNGAASISSDSSPTAARWVQSMSAGTRTRYSREQVPRGWIARISRRSHGRG